MAIQQEAFPKEAFPAYPNPAQQKGKEQAPDYSGQMSNFASRLRLLEERYSLVQRRSQLIDKNMLQHAKDLHTEMKSISAELADVKRDLSDLNEKTKLIIRDLGTLAPREEVEILKKYISYWEPLNFVSRNEVERIVREIMDEKKG